ncbi:MAG: hypothetical protein ACLP5V_01855 [Candidatus Bathyarchaeia archaeon]
MVQRFARPRNYAILEIVPIIAIIAAESEQQPGLGGSHYNSSLPSYVAIAALLATAGLVAYG